MFFKQYLAILSPTLSPRLRRGELDVLGEILYLNHKYSSIPEKERGIIIFDHDNRHAIMDNLNISYNTLGNIIMSLRKKNYLKGNSVIESLLKEVKDKFEISYIFDIEDE